jgi:DNA-directed RNA polymerase specialized sigma24 family protein
VGHLDERYRLPLILRYHYGLSCGEVADVLGLATGTVYVRLSEGRRRLRQMLLERGQADRSGKRRKG